MKKIWRKKKKLGPPPPPQKTRLPSERGGIVIRLCLGEVKGYLVVGRYPDGSVGEFFWRTASQGDFNRGIINALFESISLGLQRGIPLRQFALHFVRTNFRPNGFTGDKDVPNASSILDYAFRKLMLRFPAEVGPEGLDYWK